MRKASKKLTIAYLDFDDIKNPLLAAGQARSTYQVAKRLIKKGHKVKVYCSRYPGSKDRRQEGIEYVHMGVGTKNIKLNNAVYILFLPFVVPGIKADIVVECFTAPITTLLSPLFTRLPVVALPTSFEAERFSKLYKLPFYRIEKWGLRFYKYFLPTSKYFEEKIRRVNPSVHTRIVPLGVNKEYFNVKKSEPKHILFLGRFDIGQKGMDMLLKAYSQIVNEIGYPLVLVGYGPDGDEVKRLIKKCGLRKRIRIVDGAFGKKKQKLFSNAVCFVVPSRHEGFCIAALESLSFGVPIVSFNIPGLSWADTKVSLKARPFDVKEFANKMLAASKSYNRQKSDECRKFARNFTWDAVANSYEDFFQEMIKMEEERNV